MCKTSAIRKMQDHHQRDHGLVHSFRDSNKVIIVHDTIARISWSGSTLLIASSRQPTEIVMVLMLPISKKMNKVLVGGYDLLSRDLNVENFTHNSIRGIAHKRPKKGFGAIAFSEPVHAGASPALRWVKSMLSELFGCHCFQISSQHNDNVHVNILTCIFQSLFEKL
jgi:hypothetical protein